MSDLATQLALLRRQRDHAGDPALRAALDAAINALEGQPALVSLANAQAGDVQIGNVAGGDLTMVDRQHSQAISGGTVGVAVSGDVHGGIFLDGRVAADHVALLRAYLERLATDCAALPLQPFQDRPDLRDAHAVSLAQVYTDLATTAGPVPRERLAGDTLAQFDGEAPCAGRLAPASCPARAGSPSGARPPRRSAPGSATISASGSPGTQKYKVFM